MFFSPAIFHMDNNSVWVEFPDLEGCQTYGDTVNDTIIFAQEALSAYLMTLMDDGSDIPGASDIKKVIAEGGNDTDFVSLVSCDIDQYNSTKTVKKTLTIPSWPNDRAVSLNINFSHVLQEALFERIIR